MTSIREALRTAVIEARDRAIAAGELPVPKGVGLPTVGLERPARPEHGDFASNAAMQLAPVVRRAPMAIAETLRTRLGSPPGVLTASVAPPGFLNLQLDPAWVAGQVAVIRAAGDEYGRVRAPEPHRINVEFVSANPTGPLTVGNARGAFVGDLLSRVLEAVGHDVVREYYFNDFNAQVRNLGLSLLARHEGREPPQDGYHGDYVTAMVAEVPDELWQAAAKPGADPGE
ncbi:MAG TPA: arginine--tRNA ligase, partial [Candidatus Limnocylindria bacterium]|nr:arginine--tRNA ligase [Candidatus Limnocylindria bacterium]